MEAIFHLLENNGPLNIINLLKFSVKWIIFLMSAYFCVVSQIVGKYMLEYIAFSKDTRVSALLRVK